MPLPSSAIRGWAFGLAAVCTPSFVAPAPARPALEVLVVVDQMRGDYLDRFGAGMPGGLGRLAREGVVFTDAYQDHAVTETALGHSTLLSGRPPASTGIVSNRRGVPDSSVTLIDAKGPGASPVRFQGTALYDWLRARDPGTRALSVSRKDRGAILPIGRGKADVYWYASGVFTTSTYYRTALPAWLVAWNARRGAARLAGHEWVTLRPTASYAEPDAAAYENGGRDVVFPHRLPADTAAAQRAIEVTPWIDSLTLDVALEGAHALNLGRRVGTDLLVVSLSATDAIGHRWGPDSREVHDQLLRLDGWLGAFLDSLAALVPKERTVVALTADHGVQSYPERGRGGRTSLRAIERALEARFGDRAELEEASGLLLADTAAIARGGVRVDSVATATAAAVRALPGVRAVFTPATLAAAPAGDEEARLWRRTIPRGRPWLVAASLEPGWMWSDGPGSADHGTTVREDTHVPIVFLVPGTAPQRVARRVTTEDIGPTLAALAGVQPTEPVTGRVLREATVTRSPVR
jgi:hypothetical protein